MEQTNNLAKYENEAYWRSKLFNQKAC